MIYRPSYPWYFDPPTYGILTLISMLYRPPIHGMLTDTHDILTPTHGISTPYPYDIDPTTHVVLTLLPIVVYIPHTHGIYTPLPMVC